MYVYCLNKTWTIEEEHFLEPPDIFKDYEKGKEAFKKKMEEILREDFNNDPEFYGYVVDTNIDEAKDGENLFFEVYQEGWERVDNTMLELVKTEVIE